MSSSDHPPLSTPIANPSPTHSGAKASQHRRSPVATAAMRSYAAELPADLPDATPPGRHGAGYVAAQLIARIAGAVLDTAIFDFAPPETATTRASTGLWLGEMTATAGPVAVIFALSGPRWAQRSAPKPQSGCRTR
ncbi:MAG: hypothetical protein ABR528_03825 [Pseudonocardiaceae bacterium]